MNSPKGNRNYYVYITTNPSKKILYCGITNDIRRRVIEHFLNREDKENFAEKYYCYNLICFEHFWDITQAIQREKEIILMTRKKKEELIAKFNPGWDFIVVY